MKIVHRTPRDRRNGSEVGQLISGICGAFITTLPSFIIIPAWAIFINRYRIVDESGNDDDFSCGFICFMAGTFIWVTFFVSSAVILDGG